jgi:hypothetical protein
MPNDATKRMPGRHAHVARRFRYARALPNLD